MVWLSSVFQSPPSLLITGISMVNVISMANIGYAEISGNHLKYSKFWNHNSNPLINYKVSSRFGMLFIYTPSFLAALSSFFLLPHHNLRFLLLLSALAIHFFKRIFEVMFIHKYSGGVIMDSGFVISLGYLISTSIMIYSQHLSSQELGEPPIDLKHLGVVLFILGISGNFYHHYLLSRMRKDGEKEYKIPEGGLFGVVVCPHYLFEILGFVGISLISQNVCALSNAIGVTLYLMGRSYATRKWYISKFEDFPKHVKALFPYLL